ALGVSEAARRAGLRIPDDLSVVGFENIDHAAWVAPGLTTVRQEFASTGATAGRLPLDLAPGPPHAPPRRPGSGTNSTPSSWCGGVPPARRADRHRQEGFDVALVVRPAVRDDVA